MSKWIDRLLIRPGGLSLCASYGNYIAGSYYKKNYTSYNIIHRHHLPSEESQPLKLAPKSMISSDSYMQQQLFCISKNLLMPPYGNAYVTL